MQPLRKKDQQVPIPAGHVWVEGDEAFHSRDSNSFGTVRSVLRWKKGREWSFFNCIVFSQVPIGLINAKVTYVLWPPSRFGPVEKKPVNKDRVKLNAFNPGRDE